MQKKLLTLVMIHQHPRVLLGLKKRGHGAGKWNGFGGKVGEGEDIVAAAERELHEEVGLKAHDLCKLGVITFDAVDEDTVMEVHLFKATQFSGEPTESDEMLPQWYHVDEIPFDKMWLDDPHWFPLMLEGRRFNGRFLFEGHDKLVDFDIAELP